MSYQSLLFCPDEKTARIVTQVLAELEFAVEPCSEPFAAVKKLMGEHFDAIVVDCDNEQNATLLFKSARNSASNQASLAVAVVEGQAGVAKAFRIGANLVLTKPINVEQAKGTLRVARGLLRKGEPAKAAAPLGTAPVPAPPSKKIDIAASVPTVPANAAVQALNASAPMRRPSASSAPSATSAPPAAWQVAKSGQSPNSVVVGSASAAHGHDEIGVDVDVSAVTAVTNPAAVSPSAFKPAVKKVSVPPISKPAASPATPSSFGEAKPLHSQDVGKASTTPFPATLNTGKAAFGTGAASAPAPARSTEKSALASPASTVTSGAESPFEKTAESSITEASTSSATAPVPLSLGGLGAESSSGGSRKALWAVAATVVVATGLYAGRTQFHARATSSLTDSGATTQVSTATDHAGDAQPVASATTPLTSIKTPAPGWQVPLQPKAALKSAQPDVASVDSSNASKATAEPDLKASQKVSNASSNTKPATGLAHAAPAIVMKKGAALPSQTDPADTAAPNVMVTAANAGGSLPNLIGNPGTSARPVLQTLNVSQGVSQGLLIKKVQPSYPSNALHMHVEGAVQLLATIGKSGNITAVKILNGEPSLARAAGDAVKQWKYKPYYLNGEPVEIQTQITVNFTLPR